MRHHPPNDGRPSRTKRTAGGPSSAHTKASPRKKGLERTTHRDSKSTLPAGTAPRSERVAKIMARAGVCSRREAEQRIGEGRVALNGVVLTDPAVNAGEKDMITLDGARIAQRCRTRLFLFHKPRGLVTTERDPEGRKTVFDYLHEHWPEGPRVVSIGRLDINTEGLLLLTNDGGLARVLELPSTGWTRRYRVRANGETDQATLDRLRDGIAVDGITYAGIEATLDRKQGANCWLTMTLREGKNREIKRVLEHIGLAVNRLIRLSYGPFQLGELAEGAVEEVRTRVLRDQLGPSLAEAAGADFSSPVTDAHVEAPREDHAGGPRKKRTGAQRAGAHPRTRKAGAGTAPREQVPDRGSTAKRAMRVRKHVSVLRQEAADRPGLPRKRKEQGQTADRSGRVVVVERLIRPDGDASQERGGPRKGRRPAEKSATRPGSGMRKGAGSKVAKKAPQDDAAARRGGAKPPSRTKAPAVKAKAKSGPNGPGLGRGRPGRSTRPSRNA